MPKGVGGGGVGDFQAIQAYEKFTPPRKWVFLKITPPVYVTGPKFNPPTPTPVPSGHDVPPISKLRTTRVLAGCR